MVEKQIAIGAIVWALVGAGVAAIVSIAAVLVWAPLVFIYAAPVAAGLGALFGVWLWWSGPSRQFAAFEGALCGLLGFVPTFCLTHGDSSLYRVLVYVIAAAVGGAVAARVQLGIASGAMASSSLRSTRRLLLAGGAFIALAAGEWLLYGERLVRRLPISPLQAGDVISLPAGNAAGTSPSTCFEYATRVYESTGVEGQGGGTVYITQTSGRIHFVWGLDDDHPLDGGINQDGKFWAGAQVLTPSGEIFRRRIDGRYVDEGHLQFLITATVIRRGRTIPSRESGTALRCR